MKSNDRPEAYGVFKPVGHVIVALPTAADAQGARSALLADGFDAAGIVAYSPDEMKRQADIDIEQAGVLAGIGQELNLVKAHRELAEKGYSFLVVKAPDDDDAQKVADIAPLAGLENLRSLYLNSTQVADIAPIARLENLRSLSLDNTKVADIAPIAGLEKLEAIYVESAARRKALAGTWTRGDEILRVTKR